MQPIQKTPQLPGKVSLPDINWNKKHYGCRQLCSTETALLEVILMLFAVVPLPKVTEPTCWQELFQRSSCNSATGNDKQPLLDKLWKDEFWIYLCWTLIDPTGLLAKGTTQLFLDPAHAKGLCPQNQWILPEVGKWALGWSLPLAAWASAAWQGKQTQAGTVTSVTTSVELDGCPPAGYRVPLETAAGRLNSPDQRFSECFVTELSFQYGFLTTHEIKWWKLSISKKTTATNDVTTHPPLHPQYKSGSAKTKQSISIVGRQAPDTEVSQWTQNNQQMHFTVLAPT